MVTSGLRVGFKEPKMKGVGTTAALPKRFMLQVRKVYRKLALKLHPDKAMSQCKFSASICPAAPSLVNTQEVTHPPQLLVTLVKTHTCFSQNIYWSFTLQCTPPRGNKARQEGGLKLAFRSKKHEKPWH